MMKLSHSSGYLPGRARSGGHPRATRPRTHTDPAADSDRTLTPEQLYHQDIEVLPLTLRTLGTLRRSYIDSIDVLIGFEEDALLQLPQLGEKTLREIKCVLEQHGLRLGVCDGNPPPTEDGPIREACDAGRPGFC